MNRPNDRKRCQQEATVYRFGDSVAFHTFPQKGVEDSSPTIYLTPEMAESIARAMLDIVEDLPKPFHQSGLRPLRVDMDGKALP